MELPKIDIPDFMEYKDKFTQSGFVEKISHIAKRAGAKLIYIAFILYYVLQDPTVAIKEKALIIGALGYLITPFDVMPDAIPIAGLSDDMAVLIFVLNKVISNVSEDVKAKAYARLSRWFDEEEIKEIDKLF